MSDTESSYDSDGSYSGSYSDTGSYSEGSYSASDGSYSDTDSSTSEIPYTRSQTTEWKHVDPDSKTTESEIRTLPSLPTVSIVVTQTEIDSEPSRHTILADVNAEPLPNYRYYPSRHHIPKQKLFNKSDPPSMSPKQQAIARATHSMPKKKLYCSACASIQKTSTMVQRKFFCKDIKQFCARLSTFPF